MYNVLDLGSMLGLSTRQMWTKWVDEKKARVITFDFQWNDYVTHIKEHKVDLVAFGGGADINPNLYNHKNVAAHYINEERDRYEKMCFNFAVKHKVPIVGICRGAQLACALSGGELIQDVKGHGGMGHKVQTVDGRSFVMSTAHHQMMYLSNRVKAELIAWTTPRSAGHYVHDIKDFVEPLVEPEIVYFEETDALGIQGHPEFMMPYSECVTYSLNLIEQYLLNKEDTHE